MLPTPSNFHYVFNLRDLSRIWEGILKVAPEECQTVLDVLKLWRHECTRVIADRFTDYKDTIWFIDRMKKDAKSHLAEYWDEFPEDETFFVDFLRDRS